MTTNRIKQYLALACASLTLTSAHAAEPAAASTPAEPAKVTTPDADGLLINNTKVGTGAVAAEGQTVDVHYTGWLFDEKAPGQKGKKFDSSRDRQQPLSFRLGRGEVIRGWDRGVTGMRVGGQRTLTIPPNLGYGARGAGGVIPPNATLLFEVELVSVR